ncbi:transcriptional regulator [Halorubrum tropicale]|uniref:Transcriptional regulator n=2 Tax=Halorubrum tropicale TaxID=1765655 RepID=A0A0M9ALK8_9EURY|nr:transcriptional regulator [Halorubrum tropicale]
MATGGVGNMSAGDETTGAPDSFDTYATNRDDPSFTNWLRRRAEPDWTDTVTHQFVRELGSGELADDAFRRYLVRDYAFVETLVGTVGRAVGDAPTMEAKSSLTEFLTVLTDDENDYFERAFEALDVPEATDADPELTASSRAFVDLLERAGREGGYPETLAVLVPAEWIYLEWATDMPPERPDRFYLAEWIDLHNNDSFGDFVTWLRGELDREGAMVSPQRQRGLERLFRRTVELEFVFFAAAYDQEMSEAGRRW